MQKIYRQQHHTTQNLLWRPRKKRNKANKRKTKFHIHVEIGGYVTLHPASCRSIVPEELQQKALYCYVGAPTETPPAYKCKQMQRPRRRVKKRNLDRVASDGSSSRCLHQIVRFPLWPGALVEWVGTGNCKTAHTQTGIRGQLSRMAGCKVGWVITLVSLRNKQDTELQESHCNSLECQVRCDWSCAGRIHCVMIADTVYFSLLGRKLRFHFYHSRKYIHGFKSTQFADKRVESMTVMPGDKKITQRNLVQRIFCWLQLLQSPLFVHYIGYSLLHPSFCAWACPSIWCLCNYCNYYC